MTPKILKLIAEIDEYKGYWNATRGISAERLSNLRVLATIESIGSSTRIEGSRLSDAQVSALLEGLDIKSFQSRDEQEVAGYASAMRTIHESHNEIALTENNINFLHKILLQYSSKDDWQLGEYKKHPNHVAAFDSDGRQIGIIFETAAPLQTPPLMNALVKETIERFQDEDAHPLLVISDFVVRFLAIHPFQDGNGRLARILTNLLLLRSGYDFVQYSSHERIVEANKDEYYRALRQSRLDLEAGAESPPEWTEFFMNMLKKQKDLLAEKIERENRIQALPQLSEKILALASDHGRISVAFIATTLKANRNTVKKHLQKLVQNGHLNKRGQGRGTYYTCGTDL